MMARNIFVTSKFKKAFTYSFSHGLRKMCSEQNDVIIRNVKDKGVIIFNRPKALNAMTLSMINKIYSVFKKWESEKTLVLVKGAGDRAFSAGGDLRAVADARSDGKHYEFFKRVYITNSLMESYKIPYISFMDGIVMGGGVGLSIQSRYRIATERTVLALPETQIGHFPDVGGSYFLPRLTGQLGTYLGLTGYRLKGSEVHKVGIATHYCESKDLKDLEEALLNCSNEQDMNAALTKFSKKDESQFSLESVIEKINHCFSAETVEEIISRLEKDGSKWAKDTIQILNKMSPASLKVSLRQLQLGKQLSFQECLEMEYRIAVGCLRQGRDIYEGVRAMLIDKDLNPKWNPPTLSAVSDEFVDSFFSKLPEEQELKNWL